jgi:hypothetical protein
VIAYGFWGILTEQTQALLALARVKRGALASKLHEALQQRHDVILELERAPVHVAPVKQARSQLIAAIRKA